MSVLIPETGIPELDAAFEDMAAQILALQRQVAALQVSGGVAGCYIGTVQAPGITAAVDDETPGYGTIMIRQVYPASTVGRFKLRDTGILVPAFNIAQGTTGEIAEGKQVASMPILNKPGHQLIILDPCPPV